MLFFPGNKVKKLIDVYDRHIPPHRALWEIREYFDISKDLSYESLSWLTYVVYRNARNEYRLIQI